MKHFGDLFSDFIFLWVITPLKSHRVYIYAKHTHKQLCFKTQARNVRICLPDRPIQLVGYYVCNSDRLTCGKRLASIF